MIRITGDLWLEDRPLARGLDLTCAPGTWMGILGASGVGKSTLGRIVAGLPVPARLQGTADVTGAVTLMGQQDQLLPWASALDNVTIGARLRGQRPDRDRARALLAELGLAGLEARRPAHLSGGQRQRVALARTLIEDRPVIVLDEPFSALDAGTRAQMQDLAARHLAGRTVILITHDPLEAARLCHRAVLIGPAGSRALPLPATAPPRALDDPAVLAAQAALFATLVRPCAA
ncbi:ATP-binding cassette domain-containing protein [Paracoccus hibiscisoli]|uniref:ABC transporter ATP-binding protein n=1 Tax=Paracoccus hibiscisoli TaxID=2023261 RepID=A0A4V5MTE7_9RHOB|nr:ATP-binding cassette domain-containing protein [Paracoccus hibiscisoli]TJZ83918.1 ABC transporter ATP-binding protein [Paracoccus hibiscisoli]